MVNAITTQTIHDGERNLVVKAHIVGDGSGEESDTGLIDVSSFTGSPDNVKIMSIQGELSGFSMSLSWDATANVKAQNIPAGDSEVFFTHIGGLVNNSGAGKTGDIVFSTLGLGANDEGTVVIEMKKRGA